jgi:hypothetical protein
MRLNHSETPPRTLSSSRIRLALSILLLLPMLSATGCGSSPGPELVVLPEHFTLHSGEQIHYTVLERPREGSPIQTPCRILVGFGCPDVKYVVEDPNIVRLVDSKGLFEAVRPGRTQVLVRAPTSERRITVEVVDPAQLPMVAVPHSTVREIAAKELLFVGHANRDGFDHTAVAKPGIDRLVQEAKNNHWTVAYFVSQEYPDWYTADRSADYTIISEGQEHEIRVTAERVTFTGGDFMFCLLRNAQMTFHGMIKHTEARRIHFVFPAQAIWVADFWGPGDKQNYPAPMLLLTTLFARRANDTDAYTQVVVPFLDRMIMEFPVIGYPAEPPSPPLSDLIKSWSVVVRFGDRFEHVYRRGEDSSKTLVVEFQGM